MADKTVKELKHMIKTTIIQDQVEPGDKLRLISCGKLLKDNKTLQDSGVHDNAIIDCSITKFAVLRDLATEISLDESNISNDLRGFDRLQQNGFSEEEVGNIRAHFSADVSRVMQLLPPLADVSERRFRAEEEWLRRHSTEGAVGVDTRNVPIVVNTVRAPTRQRVVHLLVGFALASFFGFLMIFLIADPNRPLSRSFKTGLFLGVALNAALQMWTPSPEEGVLSTELMMPASDSQDQFILHGKVISRTELYHGDLYDLHTVVPVVGSMGDT